MIEVSFLVPSARPYRNGRVWIKFYEGDSFTLDNDKYTVISATGNEIVFDVVNEKGQHRKRKMTPTEAGRLYWSAKLKSQWKKSIDL